jgi:hypothetical protein
VRCGSSGRPLTSGVPGFQFAVAALSHNSPDAQLALHPAAQTAPPFFQSHLLLQIQVKMADAPSEKPSSPYVTFVGHHIRHPQC